MIVELIKPALAMLVSSDDISMDSERLASAQRPDAVGFAILVPVAAWFLMIVFNMNAIIAPWLAWRKTHCLHSIIAFDAISR